MTGSQLRHVFLWSLRLSGLVLAASFSVGHAHAAPLMRTWVSVGGDDNNTCSRLFPCQTWQGALNKTAPGGEVDVLDSGDFGVATIIQSVTIDGQGQLAAIASTVFGGISVAANAGDVVRIRNLTINGLSDASSSGGTYGIDHTGGTLVVENCIVQNFVSAGIRFAPAGSSATAELIVTDTIVSNNGLGIGISPLQPVKASIVRAKIIGNNGGGIRVEGGPAIGPNPIAVGIWDSAVNLNSANGLVTISTASSPITVSVTNAVIAANGQAGVQSNAASGGTSIVTVGGSILASNGSALKFVGGGASLLTYGNNQIYGPNGTGFTGPIAQQ